MKTFHLLSFFFLFSFLMLSCATFSQTHEGEDEGIFAYGNNSRGKKASYNFGPSDYKYKVAKAVLDDLIKAKGDRRLPAPTFKMSNAERKVAYAKPADAVIALEEKGYDICASFGKDSLNALAVILSHELTHYYEKHDWEGRQKKELEKQADYLGGFLAYTAGYDPLGVMPVFLERTYEEYNFSSELKGYPSLEERKQLAIESEKVLRDLIDVFEAANYMVILEQFEKAKLYYEYILLKGQFQSREIYNNIGVASALAAIDLFHKDELKFIYPIELDPNSRLSPGTKNVEEEETRTALLKEAIEAFKQASDLDPQYPNALINTGCAHALLKNYFDANYFAQKALNLGKSQEDNKVIGDAYTLMGIIAGLEDKIQEATDYFDQGIALKNPLAKNNKLLLLGELEGTRMKPQAPTIEKIDNIRLDVIVNKILSNSFSAEKQVDINRDIIFLVKNEVQSKILAHYEPYSRKEAYQIFHITSHNYSGKTLKDIGIGTPREEVKKLYGVPYKTVELTNGQALVYNQQQIIFVMNEAGNIHSWCVYRKNP